MNAYLRKIHEHYTLVADEKKIVKFIDIYKYIYSSRVWYCPVKCILQSLKVSGWVSSDSEGRLMRAQVEVSRRILMTLRGESRRKEALRPRRLNLHLQE